jgi:2-methylcitrate dehydratase
MKPEKDGMPHAGADPGPFGLTLDRRQLLKFGAGVVTTAAVPATAQQRRATQPAPVAPGSVRKSGEISPFTGPGYKNDVNRVGHNGPMDDTTRKIVKFVTEFKASKMTPEATHAFNRTMIDSMASLVAGFEEEPCRIAARVARLSPPGAMKCTILGYGIETTPEVATFANGCLIRMVDFNDNGEGGHVSTLIPAALAIGEALHSSGTQVMEAIVAGYEVAAAPAGGESVIAAMVAGKLMSLDEDRLANALTIALTPHVALNKGVGALSMWKGTRSAESAKCGVWAALLAREGMTGPPQPFEGRGGLWASRSASGGGGGAEFGANAVGANGMGREFTMPVRADSLAIQRNWFKRRPSEASSQGILVLMPEIRAWVKPDDVAAIHWDTSYGVWEEICDAPKWDPRNRETADHSEPYIIARALIDGDIYMDSFDEAKFMDPAARALMAKTTMGPVNGWTGLGMGRLTITKKSGETKYWDTYNGVRNLELKDYPHLTEQEVTNKFNRACAFKHMADTQREAAYKVWSNVAAVKDIGDAMRTLAKFGQPKAL